MSVLDQIFVDPELLSRVETDPLKTPLPPGVSYDDKVVEIVMKLLIWAAYGNSHDPSVLEQMTPSGHEWLFHPDWLLTKPDMQYYGVEPESQLWKEIQAAGGRHPANPCVSCYPDPPSQTPGWHQMKNGMWQRTDNPAVICLCIDSMQIMTCVSSSETAAGSSKRWTTADIAATRTVADFVERVRSLLP